MKREWKPGDVAIVDNDGKSLPITFFENSDRGGVWFTNAHGYQHRARDLDLNARPLVVIDPEDREQVERLVSLASHNSYIGVESWQAALREFANPTPPKPEEPTGLGAVVEDDKGKRYVRTGEWKHPWIEGMASFSWHEFPAVRVLSEGVTQ